jgi:hypothetical protein
MSALDNRVAVSGVCNIPRLSTCCSTASGETLVDNYAKRLKIETKITDSLGGFRQFRTLSIRSTALVNVCNIGLDIFFENDFIPDLMEMAVEWR